MKQYKEQNKDKIKEQNKKYKEQNKDKIKEQQKQYRAENKHNEEEVNDEYSLHDFNRVLSLDELDVCKKRRLFPIIISQRERDKIKLYENLWTNELRKREGWDIEGYNYHEEAEEALNSFRMKCYSEHSDYIESIPAIPLEDKLKVIEYGKNYLKEKRKLKLEKEMMKEREFPKKVKDAIRFYEKSEDYVFRENRKPYYLFIQQFPNFYNMDEILDLLYNGSK